MLSFWLLKDISWCMIWKPLGIAMIIPTLSIAIWIAWKNRQIKSELAHNLAIVFWITANAYWMISEFLGFDEMLVWKDFTGKHLCAYSIYYRRIDIAVLLCSATSKRNKVEQNYYDVMMSGLFFSCCRI